ncbi:MAG: 30S ribosomal protein S13 [Patescibacteria group bacterium]
MPRIAGIDIPDHKKVSIALRYIYGVGPKISEKVIDETRIDANKRARDLTADEINRIQRALDKVAVEGDLRRIVSDNITRLKRIKAYRGLRHIAGLPARGQRTRSNARTKRTGRRTVGALTKEMAAKLEAAKASK